MGVADFMTYIAFPFTTEIFFSEGNARIPGHISSYTIKEVPKYKYALLKASGPLGNTTKREKANCIKYTGHLCRSLGLKLKQFRAMMKAVGNVIYSEGTRFWEDVENLKNWMKIKKSRKSRRYQVLDEMS